MEHGIEYRVLRALGAVVFALTVGTLGFWLLSSADVSIGDCLYMTVITLSTVGYGEVIPMTGTLRTFASLLIIFGMGSLIYFGSTVVAFFIEFDLRQVRRRRHMKKTIDKLEKHVIVCGIGTTGSRVVHELIAAQMPFVMLENQAERIEYLKDTFDLDKRKNIIPYIQGDATSDRVLHEAGVERASGLVAALPSDKDNLYIILSARQINAELRIIARATEMDASPKMIHAGADRVVSPNLIGGMRIASEMLRPQVVEFLDQMLRDTDQNTRIEQVAVPEGSALVGKKLADTNIRKSTDVLVIATRDSEGVYTYNPGPETRLVANGILVVLGSMDSILKLRKSIPGKDISVSVIADSVKG
jgi:voltage-gated potassium channel